MLSDARRIQLMWLIYIATFLVFVYSLFVPAISFSPSKRLDGSDIQEWRGWWFLLLGPLGILIGQFGWWANPLMLPSALPLKRTLTLVFAVLAILLAASSVTLTYVPVLDVKFVVRGARLGFYLWLACPVLLLLAALLRPERRDVALSKVDADKAAVGPALPNLTEQSLSATPRYFRHQLVLLSRARRQPQSRDIEPCSQFLCDPSRSWTARKLPVRR
jgi:hypothetical protein